MDLAVYDRIRGGYRVFIGDLGPRIGKYELEKEFKQYGPITDTWVARNPPGFAFLVFKYAEDAESAVKKLHGRHVCGRRIRVEHARPFEERRRLQMEEKRNSYRPRYSRSRSRDRYRSRSRSRDHRRSRSRDRRSRSRDRKRSRSRSRTRKSKRSRRSRTRSRSGSRKRRNSRKSVSVSKRSKSGSPKHENGDVDRDKSRSRSRERSTDRKKSESEDTDAKRVGRSPSIARSEEGRQNSVPKDDIDDAAKDRGNESE